ncbi:hypothetical protein DEI91_05085 [Curtobacterium sp. MCBD17_032]|nr:hypothetical protein DEI91_05085 [Curtobacterium sp. MCBD17_032]
MRQENEDWIVGTAWSYAVATVQSPAGPDQSVRPPVPPSEPWPGGAPAAVPPRPSPRPDPGPEPGRGDESVGVPLSEDGRPAAGVDEEAPPADVPSADGTPADEPVTRTGTAVAAREVLPAASCAPALMRWTPPRSTSATRHDHDPVTDTSDRQTATSST